MKSEQLPATPNWWWTLAGRVSSCERCGEPISRGAQIAYDSHARKVLCVTCAEDTDVSSQCQESKRFREWVSS